MPANHSITNVLSPKLNTVTSKQQFPPEKLSKFSSTLHSDSLIECQIKHIVRKILQAVFALLPQLNGALQNYSIVRPGYRSVRFLDTKCTFGIRRTYCHFNLCRFFLSTLNFMLQENPPSWQWLSNELINVRILVLYTWPSWAQLIEYHFWDLLL